MDIFRNQDSLDKLRDLMLDRININSHRDLQNLSKGLEELIYVNLKKNSLEINEITDLNSN